MSLGSNNHDSLEVSADQEVNQLGPGSLVQAHRRHDSDDYSNHYNHDQAAPTNRFQTQDRPSRPIGVAFFGAFFKFNSIAAKRTFHKALVLCITFMAYTCYHIGRRPLSIVKNVLNRNCSDVNHVTLFDQAEDMTYLEYEPPSSVLGGLFDDKPKNWCDWAPFNDDATANQLLALLDSAFLFYYAIFMFFSGFLADRCNLRYFLSGGMILSGLLLYSFGMAFYLNIHSMTYFVIVQILSGILQTTGWPSVVSCVGNWFDKSSRGSIFGLWNANTNLGNILGAVIAGYFVERSWGLSFMVPGFIMSGCGVLVFLFLVPRPEDVNLTPLKSTSSNNFKSSAARELDIEQAIDNITNLSTSGDTITTNHHRRKLPRSVSREADSAVPELDDSQQSTIDNSEISPLINSSPPSELVNQPDASFSNQTTHQAVSFWRCLAIPGVIEFSLCLGFAKLVSYTFLYWLPRYITQSTLNNSEQSAYLSVPFDLGGMVGAIVAGLLSDRYRKSGLICTIMLFLAIPAMMVYEKFGSVSNFNNICLQLVAGSLVNGPYALITTAVSTDLGSRIKDGKAMATVAAIIDGTGSIGAAIGPLVAGYVSDSGWQYVFLMLIVSDIFAALCLVRVTMKELGMRSR